jgi:hypothetical protein
MLAKLSYSISASIRAAAAVCGTVLLCSLLSVSPINAQSDSESLAPWQTAPDRDGYKTDGYKTYEKQPRRISGYPLRQAAYSADFPEATATPQPAGRGNTTEPVANPRIYSQQAGAGDGDIDIQSDACGNGAGPCNACDTGCALTDADNYCPDFNPFYRRLWFQGEYLMWWGKGASLPALATTGILGEPGTNILFGGDDVDPGDSPGGRFSLGYWLDPCQDRGFEAIYTFLGNKAVNFNQSSNGGPGDLIILRPFFSVADQQQIANPVALTGIWKGTLDISLSNEFASAEVLFRRALIQQCDRRLDLLIGYRYSRFDEDLSINQSSTFIFDQGNVPLGTVEQISDRFSASNEFNGAELGFAAKTRRCRMSMELLAKLALGSTQSRVTINGSTVVTEPGQTPVSSPGGILALPTNTGTFQRNSFTVVPELGATLGYDLTCHLKATFGYTFMYWSRIARPGDQIDMNVNPTQFQNGHLTGVPAPQFRFITSDFWEQGLNIGLDYRF